MLKNSPMKTTILLIEGKRADRPSFISGLTKKGFQVESVPNGSNALARLVENIPHVIVVDAVSMRTSGKRICQSMRSHASGVPLVLLVEEVTDGKERHDADVILTAPFTLQKLVNRIRPLITTESVNILQVGPLQLNTEQRWTRCNGKQARLTPRLVTLLRVLMEKPGVVIEREDLFRQVWDTAYTVDTRTLDVHISWLRRAVEEDPRHPQFIKTVRGIGYRLDID
jgi:DNA-binding response OmpR family regulator